MATKEDTHFTGVLLEEVVFDRVLPKKQRKQVESYLSVKYGIPLLSNGKLEYLNSTGYVYWSAPKNYAFRHRPTALGRDDFWKPPADSEVPLDFTSFSCLAILSNSL